MSSTNGKSVHQSEPTANATRKADIGLLAASASGRRHDRCRDFLHPRVVARVAGSAMPLSFAIEGGCRLAAYSYVALGRPSQVSVALSRSWFVGTAKAWLLVHSTSSSTSATSSPLRCTPQGCCVRRDLHSSAVKVWAAVVVLAFTAINFLGSRLMGRAESVIVIIKVPSSSSSSWRPSWRSPEGGCSAVTSFLAGSSGDLTGRRPVRWLRGLWPDHECCSQHCQAEARVATCDLRQRRHCDRDLLAGRERCVTNVPLEVLKGLGNSALAVAANRRSDRRDSG